MYFVKEVGGCEREAAAKEHEYKMGLQIDLSQNIRFA
jgi:hypothetical protein